MGQLLNFNPHRGLGFDPSDGVDFDIDRDRFFDADRALTFDSDRDLGFGKRGPVFRGFVCPVCNAAVTETQASCTECGATFADSPGGEVSRPSRKPIKKAPKVKAERRSDRRREAPAAAPAAAPAEPSASSAGACSRCGARVLTTRSVGTAARGSPAPRAFPSVHPIRHSLSRKTGKRPVRI